MFKWTKEKKEDICPQRFTDPLPSLMGGLMWDLLHIRPERQADGLQLHGSQPAEVSCPRWRLTSAEVAKVTVRRSDTRQQQRLSRHRWWSWWWVLGDRELKYHHDGVSDQQLLLSFVHKHKYLLKCCYVDAKGNVLGKSLNSCSETEGGQRSSDKTQRHEHKPNRWDIIINVQFSFWHGEKNLQTFLKTHTSLVKLMAQSWGSLDGFKVPQRFGFFVIFLP